MTGSIPSPLVYDGSPVRIQSTQWLKITTKGLVLVLRRFRLLVRLYWQFLPGVIMYATFPVMFYYGDIFDDNPFGHKEFVNTEIHGASICVQP